MHAYIYEANFLVDFVLNKKRKRKRKKIITRWKYPMRVAYGYKLAAFMKKEKKKYWVTNNSLQYSLQNSL